MEGDHNDAALGALKGQGFAIGEAVIYQDGRVQYGISSENDSAMVEIGQELWDLAAGRLTLLEINARRQAEE